MILIWATSQNCAGKKEKEKLKFSIFQKEKKRKGKKKDFFFKEKYFVEENRESFEFFKIN
jgi:hypothetical protein